MTAPMAKEELEQLISTEFEAISLFAPLVGSNPVLSMEVEEIEIQMGPAVLFLTLKNSSGGMTHLRLVGSNLVGTIISLSNQITSQSELGTHGRD